MDWTTPDDITARIRRRWDDGELLAARLDGTSLFPMPMRIKKPSVADLGARFDEARRWMAELEEGSRARRGAGYDVVWEQVNTRQLGRNQVPSSVVIPTEDDALFLVGKRGAAKRWDRLAELTLAAFPRLRDSLRRRPMMILEHEESWPSIVDVLRWFAANPRSKLYVRQIDIAGIDTKFIESRRGILASLLPSVTDAPSDVADGSAFEDRFGLRSRPHRIRFRILDDRLLIGGLSDIETPVAALARRTLPVERVFVTENLVNFLAFPRVENAAVVFGEGYAIELLHEMAWLRARESFYWGDIDTHGFSILSRVRTILPHVRSLLMDRATLLAHRRLWVREPAQVTDELDHLTPQEAELYDDLRRQQLGENVRLEQERLPFSYVEGMIAREVGHAKHRGEGML